MPHAFNQSKSNPDLNANNKNHCLSRQRMNQIWIHFLIGHRNDPAFAHRSVEDAHRVTSSLVLPHTHAHTHSHLPLSMARAELPRLNYKCFSGLELQDIMKQCSTLRGNYPAALLPLCSLARWERRWIAKVQNHWPLKSFIYRLPPSIPPPPWFWGAWKR